jgi:hypothetical protein
MPTWDSNKIGITWDLRVHHKNAWRRNHKNSWKQGLSILIADIKIAKWKSLRIYITIAKENTIRMG